MAQHPLGTVLLRCTGLSPVWNAAPQPYFEECTVVKHTPKGMWLKRSYYRKLKFQLNDGGRYACPTQLEAIQSFRHRRVRYVQILKSQLEFAKQELQDVTELLAHLQPQEIQNA